MAPGSGAARLEAVSAVLGEAVERGFIGADADLEAHLAHSLAFEPLLPASGSAVDLGTGGGLPGIVLAAVRPDLRWTFVEGSENRAGFLQAAADQLGLSVQVVNERAEAVGRSDRRGSWDVATARAFGGPAVVVECAAPLLRLGGRVVVSEPPTGPDRWPADGLAELGVRVARRVAGPPAFVVLEVVDTTPDRFPRRVGVPAKRPVF